VVIIADPDFDGDEAAFRIKHRRAKEDAFLHYPFNAIDEDLVTQTWAHVKALLGSETEFVSWCAEERKRAREAKNRRTELRAEEVRTELRHGSNVCPTAIEIE
jgi:hypothetical protein